MEAGEDRWSRGIIFFIIITMARDGPIYGNQVANLINEKTNGAWKPSAGSIYPALNRLTRRGLIERYDEKGKAMYKLTEKGSSLVKKIGERHLDSSPMAKFMGKMWMDAMNPENKARFMLSSMQNLGSSLEDNLKSIRTVFKNEKEYEVFLMNLELEIEKAHKILLDAKKELLETRGMK